MIPDLVQDLLQDFDLFDYILHGCYSDIYDQIGKVISSKLHKDLTVSQIQTIIWDAFYAFICIGMVADDNNEVNTPWILDKKQAINVIGTSERFSNLATAIRQLMVY